MWSVDRHPATAFSLADLFNWMPSNDTQDDGDTEDFQGTAEATAAASSQGI
jgi:hypothetical protein